MDSPALDLESDPRFPSGRWTGFFLDRRVPGKHQMELLLTFGHGNMTGEGRDFVGDFILRGRYSLEDGKCHWHKRYLGQHDIFYQGFNEGQGIWGTWELHPREIYGLVQGGFHIWPEAMGEPPGPALSETAEPPVPAEEFVEVGQER